MSLPPRRQNAPTERKKKKFTNVEDAETFD